jgi:hypothetical protein
MVGTTTLAGYVRTSLSTMINFHNGVTDSDCNDNPRYFHGELLPGIGCGLPIGSDTADG